MTLDLGRYGSREVLKLQMFDYATKAPIMYFDYANTASKDWAANRVFATGGSGGARRIAWDGEKTGTLTVETQIFTMEHLALLSGSDVVSGTDSIFKTEILKVESDGASGVQVTLSQTPVGAAGTVYVMPFKNGIISGAKQVVTSVAAKVAKLDPTATVVAGDEVEVYYQFAATSSKKISYTASGFPKYVKIAGDTLYADEVAGEMVPVQDVYHKAKLQPNYTVNMSATGDPASLSLVFDLFAVKVNGIDTLAETILYEE